MSYDLKIFRKNSTHKHVTLQELEERFHTVFDIFEYDQEHRDHIRWFTVHYRDESPNLTWEFDFQDDGCYSTRCAYGVDRALFAKFRKVTQDVAMLLDAQIQDPQISQTLIDPKDFTIDNSESDSVRKMERQLSTEFAMEHDLTNATPSIVAYCSKKAEKKFFILYFMVGRIPNTDNLQYLVLENGGFFASKVNVGETLTEVLNREISELTGSSKYYVEHITERYDTALDRFHNTLDRTAVLLRIPYFDPAKTATKYPMKWIDAQGI